MERRKNKVRDRSGVLAEHKSRAKSLAWCDLAAEIIRLERQISDNSYVSDKDRKFFDQILDTYEEEKARRVDDPTH
jgi:hypothetical protein